MHFIHFIPIATTCFSLYFFVILYKHLRTKPNAMHIFWWMTGVFFFAAGTITESINTLAGFSEMNFRWWYIFGALLGGAPLAQGTVYLFVKRKNANILSWILVGVVVVTATLVLLSPLHPELLQGKRMNGKILEWTFIRYITPFINTYGMIFLVGGAVVSAKRFSKNKTFRSRFIGNLLIALGGLLPGIGGSFTKFGYVEVLYVTEFLGMILIYSGYDSIRKDRFHPVESV